jgi:hypothetical protein
MQRRRQPAVERDDRAEPIRWSLHAAIIMV